MKPIAFSCEATLPQTPEEIVEQILDLANWPDFQGYGMLPGIESAEYEVRTPEVVGSRIRVQNSDGSRHVEQIVAFRPGELLTLHLQEFSRPVSLLATRFEETWHFDRGDGATHVLRAFQLHPRSVLSWPVLWMASKLLRRAIDRQLDQMREQAVGA